MSARRLRHRGLTLLEVILALIILGGALVAIGELIRTASRSARDARDATTAQVIADSLMSEIAAGVVLPQPMERQPDPIDPDFVVSVMVERPTQAGLIQVMVLVERADALLVGRKSEGFRLVRWMLDPGVELAAPTTGNPGG
ncbi:MAG: prepilin-type N-terminal cleavage/methylation domain-containing protein [Planctomycetota bacterium]